MIANSGLRRIQHKNNKVITYGVYAFMLLLVAMAAGFLGMFMNRTGTWTLEDTIQDATRVNNRALIDERTKTRGTVASCLQAFSFSLTVNAMLDKFGRVDPSTSTIFIGMMLGGTFGFMLDNQIGSDEGFREYLWSPSSGMKYALGSLASQRYVRFIITLFFDMFFTVILFKHTYSKLVYLAGFSKSGREWIANGFCSFFISVITFQVYANMTRFQWAYPSGQEDVFNQWVSGSTMVLCTVIMNMVYLVTETRTRVGERGINDPPVKLIVTTVIFFALYGMAEYGVLDPSRPKTAINSTLLSNISFAATDYHPPIQLVCGVQAFWLRGLLFFLSIMFGCLAFTIFVTSKQSYSGLKHIVGGEPPPPIPTWRDRLLGQSILFLIFSLFCLLILITFAFMPLYPNSRLSVARNTEHWGEACEANDVVVLASMSL